MSSAAESREKSTPVPSCCFRHRSISWSLTTRNKRARSEAPSKIQGDARSREGERVCRRGSAWEGSRNNRTLARCYCRLVELVISRSLSCLNSDNWRPRVESFTSYRVHNARYRKKLPLSSLSLFLHLIRKQEENAILLPSGLAIDRPLVAVKSARYCARGETIAPVICESSYDSGVMEGLEANGSKVQCDCRGNERRNGFNERFIAWPTSDHLLPLWVEINVALRYSIGPIESKMFRNAPRLAPASAPRELYLICERVALFSFSSRRRKQWPYRDLPFTVEAETIVYTRAYTGGILDLQFLEGPDHLRATISCKLS